MKCLLCGSETAVRRFAVTVDGEPLRLQPDFCQSHGDGYLMTVGRAIGEFIRENGETGRSIPIELELYTRFLGARRQVEEPQRPDSTISGRQEDDPDFGRGRREFEAGQAARVGELPRSTDDGAQVVEVFGAVCRCDPNMECATSPDQGRTWVCNLCGNPR